jgi:hypothetical protein
MFFRVIMSMYNENYRKHINTVYGQDVSDWTLQYVVYIIKFSLHVVDVSQHCITLLDGG